MSAKLSTSRALRRFGFRQTIRSALLIGVLGGLMMGAQGAAYAAAYPNQHSRDTFVASLKSVPALGFLAGETRDAATPASYSIYKSVALMTLLTAVWGLVVTTRLLRGQEEDGKLEPIVASQITKTSASVHMLVGFCYSFTIAFFVCWLIVGSLGFNPKVNLSPGSAGLLTVSVFLPGIFFLVLGVLTSQLALTRSRAITYGLVPLLALFILRGAANSVTDWNDLKRYTPFGWTDLLNPVLGANGWWVIPTFVFAIIVIPLSLYLMSIRDLGSSFITQSQFMRSRFYLLASDLQYAIRQNIPPFIWWALGTFAFAGLLASIARVGANALASSPAAGKLISTLGGNHNDLVIAFLGFGGLFTVLILFVMTTVTMGSVRSQETKGYLDNLLVQPVGRSSWLIKRVLIIIAMGIFISLLTGYLTWQIARLQDINLDLVTMLQNAIALTGTLFLLLGVGTLFYGLLPRIAIIIMYALIIWTFAVDIFKSFFNLNDFIDKTSLLHYVSFTPTKTPDWATFLWLVTIGIVLAIFGIRAFTKRDIITE